MSAPHNLFLRLLLLVLLLVLPIHCVPADHALFTTGSLLQASGDHITAAESFAAVLRLNPSSLAARSNFAVALVDAALAFDDGAVRLSAPAHLRLSLLVGDDARLGLGVSAQLWRRLEGSFSRAPAAPAAAHSPEDSSAKEDLSVFQALTTGVYHMQLVHADYAGRDTVSTTVGTSTTASGARASGDSDVARANLASARRTLADYAVKRARRLASDARYRCSGPAVPPSQRPRWASCRMSGAPPERLPDTPGLEPGTTTTICSVWVWVALRQLKEAARLEPALSEGWNDLGTARWTLLGDVRGGIAAYREAARHGNVDGLVAMNLARALLNAGEPHQAVLVLSSGDRGRNGNRGNGGCGHGGRCGSRYGCDSVGGSDSGSSGGGGDGGIGDWSDGVKRGAVTNEDVRSCIAHMVAPPHAQHIRRYELRPDMLESSRESEAWFMLGEAAAQLGHRGGATHAFRQAIKANMPPQSQPPPPPPPPQQTVHPRIHDGGDHRHHHHHRQCTSWRAIDDAEIMACAEEAALPRGGVGEETEKGRSPPFRVNNTPFGAVPLSALSRCLGVASIAHLEVIDIEEEEEEVAGEQRRDDEDEAEDEGETTGDDWIGRESGAKHSEYCDHGEALVGWGARTSTWARHVVSTVPRIIYPFQCGAKLLLRRYRHVLIEGHGGYVIDDGRAGVLDDSLLGASLGGCVVFVGRHAEMSELRREQIRGEPVGGAGRGGKGGLPEIPFPVASALQGWASRNYFHFVAEQLPRIVELRRRVLNTRPTVRLLVPWSTRQHSWMNATLEALGIPMNRVAFYDATGSPYRFREVWSIDWASSSPGGDGGRRGCGGGSGWRGRRGSSANERDTRNRRANHGADGFFPCTRFFTPREVLRSARDAFLSGLQGVGPDASSGATLPAVVIASRGEACYRRFDDEHRLLTWLRSPLCLGGMGGMDGNGANGDKYNGGVGGIGGDGVHGNMNSFPRRVVEAVDGGQLPMRAQVELFRSARVVVGVTGAGLR